MVVVVVSHFNYSSLLLLPPHLTPLPLFCPGPWSADGGGGVSGGVSGGDDDKSGLFPLDDAHLGNGVTPNNGEGPSSSSSSSSSSSKSSNNLVCVESCNDAQLATGSSSPMEQFARLREEQQQRNQPGAWEVTRPTISKAARGALLVARFGDRGREMMDSLLVRIAGRPQQQAVMVLEIGVFLGHSVERWLRASEKVRVIAVDPFFDKRKTVETMLMSKGQAGMEGWSQEIGVTAEELRLGLESLGGNGTFLAVQDRLWEWRDRVIFLKGKSPGVFDNNGNGNDNDNGNNEKASLADLPCVDVVYIDGGKTSNFVDHVPFLVGQCLYFFRRFPNAIITGLIFFFFLLSSISFFQHLSLSLSLSLVCVCVVQQQRQH